MTEFEEAIRLAAFVAVFAAVVLWEALAPRRKRSFERRARWPHNLGLLLVDVALVRVLVPGAAIAVAMTAAGSGWGLLNALALPGWSAIAAGIALLDLAIYFQHVMFHAVPALWRLHRVHHADLDFDVTTGARFHPIEILISTAVKCAAIAALGAPVISVFVFEILLNATAMFNHANASLPQRLERWLRWLVVTPDMHRVHHSVPPASHSPTSRRRAPRPRSRAAIRCSTAESFALASARASWHPRMRSNRSNCLISASEKPISWARLMKRSWPTAVCG